MGHDGVVHRFSATVTSTGTVAAPPGRVWALLADPAAVVAMTPLLAGIDADGDVWRWRMRRVGVSGFSFTPAFTERMTFDEPSRIDFRHAPPDGAEERAGATGSYTLQPVPGGTRLGIEVTVTVALPLHRTATPMVTRAIRATMASMGERFATNLERRLAG